MTAEMRMLTVRQPWAWAIMHGGKNVENRVRNLAGGYRGPVAIHAGLAIDHDYDALMISEPAGIIAREKRPVGMRMVPSRISEPDEPRFHVTERYGYRGAIIGVVDLGDVHMAMPDELGRIRCQPENRAPGAWREACSPWAQEANYHLVLENPRPLVEPIPYRGALGLRTLDPETTARILAQIGDPR